MDGLLGKCGNLLQNPGFENGLTFWVNNNVTTIDSMPAEGTQAARMGSGVASMFQDVPLFNWLPRPLFLSFIAYTQDGVSSSGNLVAEVLWLDAARNVIGTGLRAFLTEESIANDRITYYDVTDRPPILAMWARLQLSKNGDQNTSLVLDQLILAPINMRNMVRNPSFEQGLEGWTATGFTTAFDDIWEGNAAAEADAVPGLIYQDVDLHVFDIRASYLLGFAVESLQDSSFSVQLIWLDAAGNAIGSPGVDLFVPSTTLSNQGNYLSFLVITSPAPVRAARARIQFSATPVESSSLRIDQVLMLQLASANLIQNPGFADGLDDWTAVNTTAATGAAYVGDHYAQIDQSGGLLFQTVALPPGSTFHCFLFHFALRYTGTRFPNGNITAQVHWLDARGDELGLGISMIVPLFIFEHNLWLVYTGITERAPLGAVAATVQFTKANGGTAGNIGVDHVLLAMMD